MRQLLAVISVSLVFATPAAAVDSVLWKTVNGWSIYMDPTMGNACYVSTVYEGNTILRLGFDFSREPKTVYFALGNPAWKSLEPGKDYPIKIQFDNQPVWDATANAIEFSGFNWLRVATTDYNFASEFARKLSMTAAFNGRQIAALRLKGSAKAIDEMLICQQTVNSYIAKNKPAPTPAPADPFATSPDVKNATDPFEL